MLSFESLERYFYPMMMKGDDFLCYGDIVVYRKKIYIYGSWNGPSNYMLFQYHDCDIIGYNYRTKLLVCLKKEITPLIVWGREVKLKGLFKFDGDDYYHFLGGAKF